MTILSFSTGVALFAVLTTGAFAQTSMSITYKYSAINYPGAGFNGSVVNGINNSNAVVGWYFDSANVMHGFVYAGGNYSAVDFPGAAQTAVLGINDYNDIVGWYLLSGGTASHAFLRNHNGGFNGGFSTIDFPGSTGSAASGINKTGTIVGTYTGWVIGGHPRLRLTERNVYDG